MSIKVGDTIEWSIKYSKIIKVTTKTNHNERNIFLPSTDTRQGGNISIKQPNRSK